MNGEGDSDRSAAAQQADSLATRFPSGASCGTVTSQHQSATYNAPFPDLCSVTSLNAKVSTLPDRPIAETSEGVQDVAWPAVGTSFQQVASDHPYHQRGLDPYHVYSQPLAPAQYSPEELQLQLEDLLTNHSDILGQTTSHYVGDGLNDLPVADWNQNGPSYPYNYITSSAPGPSLELSLALNSNSHLDPRYTFTGLPAFTTEDLPLGFDALSACLQSNLYDSNHGVSFANPSTRVESFS
jgi:hypothetical protein